MQSLLFMLQASLVEFATSSSGHVEPRQGLALGWLGSVVAGLAVVFGTADQAQADSCHEIPEGAGARENCSWISLKKENKSCRWDAKGQPIRWYKAKYCHSAYRGCTQKGEWTCSS